MPSIFIGSASPTVTGKPLALGSSLTIGPAILAVTGSPGPTVSYGLVIPSASIAVTGKQLTLPIDVGLMRFVLSTTTAAMVLGSSVVNPALDHKVFDCGVSVALSGSGLLADGHWDDGSITLVLSSSAHNPGSFEADATFYLLGSLNFSGAYAQDQPQNFVAWSNIGSVSMEIGQKNTAGFAPMTWPGWALCALQLDTSVVVYGQYGVSIASPVANPIPTWGFKSLLETIGAISPYAVAGTTQVHFFVSQYGDLWKITASEGPQKLGFREHIQLLSDIVLSFDEHENRLWISDGTNGFCYDQGLGGGIPNLSGLSRGLGAGPSEFEHQPFEILTDVLDFKQRGLKQITLVELGTNSTQQLQVALDYRSTMMSSWATSAWMPVNPQGIAMPRVTAEEFRLRIRQTEALPIRLDYVNVRVRFIDKRSMRGLI